MPRRKKPPLPTFEPWADRKLVSIRHHEDNRRIGSIGYAAHGVDGEGWYLAWAYYGDGQPVRHDDVQAAIAAACDAYPALLQRDADELKQYESQDRALRLQVNAVARAVRIPTGGQQGWRPARNGDPA